MRISDWSSDVCSSDLPHAIAPPSALWAATSPWLRHREDLRPLPVASPHRPPHRFPIFPAALYPAQPMTRARVLPLTAALGPLDYRVPHGSEAPLGSVVVVPLGPRRMGGVVGEDASFGAPEAVGDNRLRNPL